MKIPFIDLNAQYRSIKNEIDRAIQQVIDNSSFCAGPFVQSFEENFARVSGAKHCLGVNSGTAALHIALWALGIGPGDEVIVPANTFFATPEAVSLCGATPRFVDCDPHYFCIDPGQIEAAITDRTRALIPVHLYGHPAELDQVRQIAKRHNLHLIEDCAQAHLAEYKGTKVGTHGICGCFSFYPGKNLGAYGEAGGVFTDDDDLYEKMLALRDHGSRHKYHHEYVGHNYRMEGIQGAVLDVKLRHLESWTQMRRENAACYRNLLKTIPEIALPKEAPGMSHVYHLFVVRVPQRDRLVQHLAEHGISTGIHYPIPCHRQRAYLSLIKTEDNFAVSEQYAQEILSLPMYAELSEPQINYICDSIKEFFSHGISG